ncbi:hypothetical protein DB31_1246 [Hyalangium minutum]|uniref:Uncharacterized protein n=1 Tax=Hyalangium minutum TaxID=394096 RepID=A0A085WER8_9BACT|nr:hypothetical protein DB31_1246 [Hyalangium minutum]
MLPSPPCAIRRRGMLSLLESGQAPSGCAGPPSLARFASAVPKSKELRESAPVLPVGADGRLLWAALSCGERGLGGCPCTAVLPVVLSTVSLPPVPRDFPRVAAATARSILRENPNRWMERGSRGRWPRRRCPCWWTYGRPGAGHAGWWLPCWKQWGSRRRGGSSF